MLESPSSAQASTNTSSQPVKICKYCKSEIHKDAKICPYCRKRQGGKLKWFVIGIVTIMIISIGSTSTAPTNSGTKNKSSGLSSSFVSNADDSLSPSPLNLVDTGICVLSASSYSDTVFFNYCGIIKNPNETKAATFPAVYATIKNSAGEVLATDHISGFYVMPEDTIALVGTISMLRGDAKDASVSFSIDYSEFVDSKNLDAVRTSNLEILNVTERSGSVSHTVAGEVVNRSGKDLDMVNVAVVMKKGGEIVYAENSFIDGISNGQTKAFEINCLTNWPEHDETKIYVQNWSL